MRPIKVFLIPIFAFVSLYVTAQNNIEGVWKSDKGDYMIKIASMGQEYQGRIVWMLDEKDENGQQKLDAKNPDEKFRKLPIKGSKIITSLKFDSENNSWSGGKLYIPEEGKFYNCEAKVSGNKLIINYSLNNGDKTWAWTRQS